MCHTPSQLTKRSNVTMNMHIFKISAQRDSSQYGHRCLLHDCFKNLLKSLVNYQSFAKFFTVKVLSKHNCYAKHQLHSDISLLSAIPFIQLHSGMILFYLATFLCLRYFYIRYIIIARLATLHNYKIFYLQVLS